ncbi:GlsB/YeaQ/YmgE family stress response membrane protein [Acidipropionibacterium jensenii]|uniref:GlsB/YeaQ/YmgE family stress response membrane protein n=1 Tax=Acidipropionibacterium jensenii TaxID=1749 RepID=A0A3Q9UMB7_9ACTN|nr:GlsB/YeaQ/YmgE family stress response membrane protein [Acidipropionibacterium jensenii]MDN6556841.1 GlsB/YeaQ/YmgE family stress response membrane protein [Acidipropionibacterium acidipropionici]AZZ40462.1 GlsB/YeaQ/YmgE family stress response membrane protein [Acidipropionibacterium jensenii]AZZ43012.1 GlsB/YeaQ/YmgE family stress response membrane protein [Acidipropionibacterium jensenii]MDN5977507.1 GlsB/YeaQ/YmgE family stress response membrane protein [Acidipropionibacterium jensenii]
MGNIISWIIIGILAGAVAKLILPGKQEGGWFSTMVLGLIGAIVGGLIGGLFGGGGVGATFSNPWSWGSFITAVIGAIIFSFVWGWIRSRSKA